MSSNNINKREIKDNNESIKDKSIYKLNESNISNKYKSIIEMSMSNDNNFQNNNKLINYGIKNSFEINDILKDKEMNNIENNANDSISLRQAINNPILTQLIEFGYNPIYSKRKIQYFHPQDIEEAQDYLLINGGIINHHFIKDRTVNNNICYACGEIKEIHLGYIPENISEDIDLRKNSIINNMNNIDKE